MQGVLEFCCLSMFQIEIEPFKRGLVKILVKLDFSVLAQAGSTVIIRRRMLSKKAGTVVPEKKYINYIGHTQSGVCQL